MRRNQGFSLAELAVTMLIVSLLLAGALIPFGTQIDLKNVTDTQRTMDSIREAIIGFAQANGRLPCPAISNSAAGTEQATCTSAGASFGVVPWATLGVPETDAWGRRFSYRVSPIFADVSTTTWATTAPAAQNPGCTPTPTPTAPTSFALCSLGNIAVFTRGLTTTAAPLATALPAVIISHGKNGLGAWLPSGNQVTPVPPANTDEGRNINGNTTATPQPSPPGYSSWAFYSRTPSPAAAGCVDPAPVATNTAPPCEFDDIVYMITSNVLIARMVSAGRLP